MLLLLLLMSAPVRRRGAREAPAGETVRGFGTAIGEAAAGDEQA
jgi:hypothetical protein